MANARLEDFGVRGTVSPEGQYLELVRQCKMLPQDRQAKFWLDALNKYPDVAKIAGFKTTRKGGRKK